MDKYAPTSTHPAETFNPVLPPLLRERIDAGRAAERLVQETCGHSATSLQLLSLVAYDRGITPSLLAFAMGVPKSSVSSLLGALDQRGFIKRSAIAGDARRVHVDLAPAGEQLLVDCREKLAALS